MSYKIDAVFMVRPLGRSDAYGVDHQVELKYFLPVTGEEVDREIQLYAGTCAIPRSVMNEIKNAPANQKVALYIQAIQDYLYVTPVPEPMPLPPQFFDYDEYDEYIEELLEWEALVAECVTLATLADGFIRSQPGFDEYPYNFTMRTED